MRGNVRSFSPFFRTGSSRVLLFLLTVFVVFISTLQLYISCSKSVFFPSPPEETIHFTTANKVPPRELTEPSLRKDGERPSIFLRPYLSAWCRYKGFNKYDYVALIQSWPPSLCLFELSSGFYCKVNSVKEKKLNNKGDVSINRNQLNYWIMRGFRPETEPGRRIRGKLFPECCTNTKFQYSNFSMSLKSTMEKQWPDLYYPELLRSEYTERGMWANEWNRYGTCLETGGTVSNQEDFFSTTFELKKKYDIRKAFEAAGIYPNNTAPLKLDTLYDAVQKMYNVRPYFSCKNVEGYKRRMEVELRYADYKMDPELNDGGVLTQILHDTWICFDKNLKKKKAIDCPKSEQMEFDYPCDATKDVMYPQNSFFNQYFALKDGQVVVYRAPRESSNDGK